MDKVNRGQPNIVELDLLNLVHGGDCLAKIDGQVVFVAFGIPEERVEARLLGYKGDFAMARTVSVTNPSPHRIEPVCPYFGRCGGCQLQHIEYEHQLELKRQIVAEQLQRIGKLDGVEVLPTLPSPQALGYRNHGTFKVQRGELGFTWAHSQRFQRIDECKLMHPTINNALAEIQGKIKHKLHQVTIRVGVNTDDILVNPKLLPEEGNVESGQESLEEILLDQRFRMRGNAFFQVNTPQAERLIETVREGLSPRSDELLLDIYCGVGSFSMALAGYVKKVIGIESYPAAVEDARYNAREVNNVEYIVGPAEREVPALTEQPDIVIVDPPRAGCKPEVIEAISKAQPRKIAYVSCDPATLARDLRTFVDSGYRIEMVQPVDMFPQTYHVETVVLLTKV